MSNVLDYSWFLCPACEGGGLDATGETPCKPCRGSGKVPIFAEFIDAIHFLRMSDSPYRATAAALDAETVLCQQLDKEA